MFKFNFSAFTRSFPGICFIGGLALIVLSLIPGVEYLGLTFLGIVLIFASIGLYIYSVNSRKGK